MKLKEKYGKYNKKLGNHAGGLDDKGGASRFFYCAKASKSERNKRCEGMEEVIKSDRNAVENIGANNPRNRTGTPKKNHHPTVKPLKLMEYLCTLTKTPTGGMVLDPFIGSGTTAVACQNTNREFIGFEREQEYVDIANKRLKPFKEQKRFV